MSHLQVKNTSIICTRTPSRAMAKEEQSWSLRRIHRQQRRLVQVAWWHPSSWAGPARRRVGFEAGSNFTAGAGRLGPFPDELWLFPGMGILCPLLQHWATSQQRAAPYTQLEFCSSCKDKPEKPFAF